jgi:nucleoid-associated protein YgaU
MIIDFVKSAGENIWGKITGKDKDREKAEKITQFIKGLGIAISDLSADVKDDTVTIKGTVKTQEDREKVILAAGNVKDIAHVNDEIKVMPDKKDDEERKADSSNNEPRFYTVVKGDSLSKIAQRYYGDANKYHRIFEANTPMLKDPDKIYPGQTLRIPH